MVNFDDNLHFVPKTLVFSGVLDKDGKTSLEFGYKKMYLGPKYEVALSKLTITNETIFNVQEGEEWFKFTSVLGNTRKELVPPSRVVHLSHLVRILNEIQDELDFIQDTDFLTVDARNGILLFSRGLALSFRMCDPITKKISKTLEKLNPGCVFTFDPSEEKVQVDCSSQAHGAFLRIPAQASDYVYDLVSTNAPQVLYMYSDIVEQEFVSAQMHPLLTVFPLEVEKARTRFTPNARQWKRIKDQSVFRRCHLQVADSTGKTYSNCQITAELSFRRRELF